MIIDTCMHLSSPDTERYPPCGDAIPYFATGGPDPTRDASPEHLRRCMLAQEVPVDRAFNFCNGWYGWDNSLAMDVLLGNDDWLGCGALLDPADPSSPDELRRLVGAGAAGLRIQPIVTGRPLDDPAATPLWEAAAELGIAIDVNLPQQDYDQIARRAREFPTIPIVVDHCGWLVGSDPETLTVDIPCELAVYPNVHVKITFCHVASREPYPHRDTHFLVHQLVEAFGADRCLWGPHSYMTTCGWFCFENHRADREQLHGRGSERAWVHVRGRVSAVLQARRAVGGGPRMGHGRT